MDGFIVVSTINAITYKEFFPLLKDGKVNTGYAFNKTLVFETPKGEAKKQCGICWYTTFPIPNKKKMVLTATYDPDKYPKYENYDAIEVGRIKDIPYDYDGVMGVPVTILDYDLADVDIMGVANDWRHSEEWAIRGTPTYIDDKHKAFQGMVLGGKAVYSRILIRRKEND